MLGTFGNDVWVTFDSGGGMWGSGVVECGAAGAAYIGGWAGLGGTEEPPCGGGSE